MSLDDTTQLERVEQHLEFLSSTQPGAAVFYESRAGRIGFRRGESDERLSRGVGHGRHLGTGLVHRATLSDRTAAYARHENHSFRVLGQIPPERFNYLLDHIQAAGYRVLYAGVATCPRRGTRRAWVECRKHEPEENESTDETNEFTLTCPKCEEEYTPDEAGLITIFGPDEARYTCPRCGRGTDGPPPPTINEA